MNPAPDPSALVEYSRSAQDNRVCRIGLNRPGQRNAVNIDMAMALRDAVSRFEDDPVARVAILCGAGPVFCAGMDLAGFAAGERPGLDHDDGFAFFVRRHRTKPIIAAVEGGAFAGGFEIMLACDLAIAATGARFSLPEVKRGLIAAGGGAVRLPARIPPAVAREMLLTGDAISSERAYELGLVNAIVPQGDAERAAEALAGRIAENAPLAVKATLAICHATSHAGEAAGWSEAAKFWPVIETSHDAREGAVAFVEKRKPRWRGQ